MRIEMVHSTIKNAKSGVRQSQVCYLCTTYFSTLKQYIYTRINQLPTRTGFGTNCHIHMTQFWRHYQRSENHRNCIILVMKVAMKANEKILVSNPGVDRKWHGKLREISTLMLLEYKDEFSVSNLAPEGEIIFLSTPVVISWVVIKSLNYPIGSNRTVLATPIVSSLD